jgi:hypothetical protein
MIIYLNWSSGYRLVQIRYVTSEFSVTGTASCVEHIRKIN